MLISWNQYQYMQYQPGQGRIVIVNRFYLPNGTGCTLTEQGISQTSLGLHIPTAFMITDSRKWHLQPTASSQWHIHTPWWGRVSKRATIQQKDICRFLFANRKSLKRSTQRAPSTISSVAYTNTAVSVFRHINEAIHYYWATLRIV